MNRSSISGPRWRVIRLCLLLLAFALVAGIWWARTQDPRSRGARDAGSALARGELVMLIESGVTLDPLANAGDVEGILKGRYGITRRVADDRDYVDAYNEVMIAGIEQRYGAGVWQQAGDEAARNRQLDQAANRVQSPTE